MRYQKTKSYKYQQHGDCWFKLHHDFGDVIHEYFQFKGKNLLIKNKYRWDGATGIPDTDKNFIAAEIHDVLAQAIREGLINIDRFEDANKELKLQYLERNGWRWWGKVLEWGTNTFGRKYFKSDIIEVL